MFSLLTSIRRCDFYYTLDSEKMTGSTYRVGALEWNAE